MNAGQDSGFLRKEVQRERDDAQNADEYQRLVRIVDAEHRKEWADDGFDPDHYTAHGNAIHAEVTRRMADAREAAKD